MDNELERHLKLHHRNGLVILSGFKEKVTITAKNELSDYYLSFVFILITHEEL